ncbi:MAG: substrate-binding domain-containing protein [Kineosporiaceae bacterium]
MARDRIGGARLAATVFVSALTLAACSNGSSSGASASGSAGSGSAAGGGKVLVGLITKTQDNPFYVKMTEGAKKKAATLGYDLQTFAGTGQSDSAAQVSAIENLTSAGAKAILVTPTADDIVPAINKAKAKGVLVLALDSPTNPTSAVDGTFATDNFKAGELVGQWAKATFAAQGKQAKIATLDLSVAQVKVDVDRNQGFLKGFGVELGDPAKMWDEKDPRLVGHEVTDANEAGGRAGMEKLLQRDRSINLVYTINEPTAAGAYQAIKAVGLDKQITIVSVDGGCPGVTNVKNGVIAATSMQFPLGMAEQALDAVAAYLASGAKPKNSDGLDFTNTGVTLITDQTASGVESKDSAWGLQNCWG